MNLANYQKYKTPFPVGVKLPQIKIEKKYYDYVGCSENQSNFNFLRRLCHKGLIGRGIDKKGCAFYNVCSAVSVDI